MKRWFFALALAALPASAKTGQFLPLQPGNTWVYQNAASGETFTMRVSTPVMHNGNTYYPITGYTSDKRYVRLGDQDGLVYYDEERNDEFLLTSFTPFEGGFWNAPGRPCEAEGQTKRARAEHSGPAGYWPDVLAIEYRSFTCSDEGLESEQYAENVGLLRRVVDRANGPQTFDLMYARVGNLTVDGGQRGRFTITAVPAADGQFWEVRVRLDLGSSPGVRVRFPSGQEYEVVLRDEAGSMVWRWSDGQVWNQAAHEKLISGEYVFQVAAPRQPGSGTGSYTLEAWLTTAGDSPSYRTALTVLETTASEQLPRSVEGISRGGLAGRR